MKQRRFTRAAARVLLLIGAGIFAACGGRAQTERAGMDTGGQTAAAADFIYRLNEARDGVVITGIQKDAGFGSHLVVPAEIEGFPVVAYMARYSDDDAKQRNLPPLVSVVFPAVIRYMGASGAGEDEYGYREFEKFRLAGFGAEFSRCASLRRVVFPQNLVIIPERFVSNCPALTPGGITWPAAPETIGKAAFYKNTFTELIIPRGVKIIGPQAFTGGFENGAALTSLVIPDSVEEIHGRAFANSGLLTTVSMPARAIRYPGYSAFTRNWAFQTCPKLSLASQTVILDSGYSDEEW
ncbi:MAG: leucine-rich repeat domain-containing protein [Spirochaetaceae bacterium]|nr:leucine-rich repeat domain-containing protein [Spirochaetaceae bacterium]